MRRLLCALLVPMLLAASSEVPELTVEGVHQSSLDLARYASSRSVDDLRKAITDLDGAIDLDDLSSKNFTASRRMLVQAWAAAFKAVEGAYDPTYDPNDPKNAFTNDAVPPELAKQNDEKYQRAEYYWQVRILDEQAMSSLEMSLKVLNAAAPAGAGSDYDALDGIVRQSGISQTRRAAIDKAITESDAGP